MALPRTFLLVLSLSLGIACATGGTLSDDDDDVTDGGSSGSNGGGASSSGGGGGSSSGSSGSSSSSSSGGGGSSSSGSGTSGGGAECGTIVINEVRHDEKDFVELYNAGDCELDMSGYKLVYRSDKGTSDAWSIDLTGQLDADDYYIIAESSYSGSKRATLNSLAKAGGGLALKKGSSIVDKMGWGSATNNFVDGQVAPVANGAKSLQRSPNGNDTDDNADDFIVDDATPNAPND